MVRTIQGFCLACLTLALLLTFPGGETQAQPKNSYEKHDASALNQSLRHVINVGAKMFNDNGDHAGCYRLYQGALLAVKPFLPGDFQKKIDAGIAKAETLPFYSERAFELRRVLDEIRASTKGGATDDAKNGTKKADPAKTGQLSGTLTLEGRPIKGGYFLTLVNSDGKKFSSAINKNGTFQFKTPIPEGEYRLAVEPIPGETVEGTALPTRYASETTSGLSIRVQEGKQQIDLNLVK